MPRSSRHKAAAFDSEAAAADERGTTRPLSSAGPASSPASEEAPAGEPEAPVAPTAPAEEEAGQEEEPSRPHGDEVGEEAIPAEPAEPAEGGERESAAHERQLAADFEELTARAEKADEYLELAQRTKADFENYRKRAARETAAAQERGIAKLAKELLPAVDNLDRALQAAESGVANGEASTLMSGIKLVHQDVIAALARVGIEPYSPQGEPFDPQHHEAVAQQPIEGAEPGTVVEVYQQGYRLGDAVLRPARVVVAG